MLSIHWYFIRSLLTVFPVVNFEQLFICDQTFLQRFFQLKFRCVWLLWVRPNCYIFDVEFFGDLGTDKAIIPRNSKPGHQFGFHMLMKDL